MKKKIVTILLSFTFIFILTGCETNLNNTPTKQAEIFLGKYQTLNDDVLSDLDKVVAEEEIFLGNQRDIYRAIMKKHYQELEYEIKDERIDGDKATVTVQIEVDDYSKVIDESKNYLLEHPDEFNDEDGNYDHSKYIDYQLTQMKNTKDRVKYILELTFTKRDKKWVIDKLSDEDMNKINGIYVY